MDMFLNILISVLLLFGIYCWIRYLKDMQGRELFMGSVSCGIGCSISCIRLLIELRTEVISNLLA